MHSFPPSLSVVDPGIFLSSLIFKNSCLHISLKVGHILQLYKMRETNCFIRHDLQPWEAYLKIGLWSVIIEMQLFIFFDFVNHSTTP
jgi:hypothetical protein